MLYFLETESFSTNPAIVPKINWYTEGCNQLCSNEAPAHGACGGCPRGFMCYKGYLNGSA